MSNNFSTNGQTSSITLTDIDERTQKNFPRLIRMIRAQLTILSTLVNKSGEQWKFFFSTLQSVTSLPYFKRFKYYRFPSGKIVAIKSRKTVEKVDDAEEVLTDKIMQRVARTMRA